jgi:putative flavoprotein involved in K+ transport
MTAAARHESERHHGEAGLVESHHVETHHVETLVIGAGQAGLTVGYELARRGRACLIVDGSERVGDAWRHRWSSLRLFTPARYDGLPGMPFPAPPHAFPTKDEMADYLEAYAHRFELPIRLGERIVRLTRAGDRYVASSGTARYVAERVVVAMSGYQTPKVPTFAADLDPDIVQLHSKVYRDPSQLQPGPVLLVGAGNSGAEIALDVSAERPTYLAGRGTGHVPFDIDGALARHLLVPLLLRGVFHRVLTTATPFGRAARPTFLTKGGPLVRLKPRDLLEAGVQRLPKVAGVRGGAPLLEDGRVMDVTNVIWCTGFRAGFEWIDLPVLEESGLPRHRRGAALDAPGLWFVGLPFLFAASSTMVHGAVRDARFVVREMERRAARAGSRHAEGIEEPLPLVP